MINIPKHMIEALEEAQNQIAMEVTEQIRTKLEEFKSRYTKRKFSFWDTMGGQTIEIDDKIALHRWSGDCCPLMREVTQLQESIEQFVQDYGLNIDDTELRNGV